MSRLLLVLLVCVSALHISCAEAQPWQQVATPKEAGYSAEALDAVRQAADAAGSGAVMMVQGGHVIVAWGDVEREFQLHSVRKSLVSALYETAVDEGAIELEATLGDLGITDREPLTEAEQQAQVWDLLTARSGVYLPSAYSPSDMDEKRPARGSHPPGTHWFYNNWDFNVSGVIYELATGESVYDAFASRIAGPIGMEDYQPSDGFLAYEPSQSMHPAQTFQMSTRDLARFGQLYLQQGRWGDQQVLSAEWVQRSTQARTAFDVGGGYGAMWWTMAPGDIATRHPGQFRQLEALEMYYGAGTGGQIVAVIPEMNLVFVHRGDTDNGDGAPGLLWLDLLNRIVAAQTETPSDAPRLTPLSATPFASQNPAPARVDILDVSPEDLDAYAGIYRIAPGMDLRVFRFAGGLFGSMPGQGEAQLFPVAEDTFVVRVVSGAGVVFERDATGEVRTAIVTLGEQTFPAEKQ